ncbi:MAG: Integrase, catalytic region, partial [uncultured Sphingomonas sp.]
GRGPGLLPIGESGHRLRSRSRHHGRARVLPAGDPLGARPADRAPGQPLQKQRAGAGPPRHQGPHAMHAGLQELRLRRALLPQPRRAARLPPPPNPPQPACPRRPASPAS